MDQLKAMKIDTKHDIEIHGIGNATIPHPSDTVRYWSDIDLASVSIGYAVEMTPLHIITLYNAIANNGVW